jgi:hypothetical protein
MVQVVKLLQVLSVAGVEFVLVGGAPATSRRRSCSGNWKMKDADEFEEGSGDEVDASLLRENLKLAPAERLFQLDALNRDLDVLRQAVVSQLKTGNGPPSP